MAQSQILREAMRQVRQEVYRPHPAVGPGSLSLQTILRAAYLEHHGDLTQSPSPQETQRHGFSCLVAAHNPL
jgi:hypothetical protein